MLTECRPFKSYSGNRCGFAFKNIENYFILYFIIIDTTHWAGDVELESVITVWTLVFAFKITNVVECFYATAVSGNEGPAFTYTFSSRIVLKQDGSSSTKPVEMETSLPKKGIRVENYCLSLSSRLINIL